VEALLIEWLKEYGYIILFLWSIMEGETGLVMAGVMSHTGDMVLPIAISVAALGGFAGDQLYFYIGRYNKNYIHKEFKEHKQKFALAHLLLKKYGWPLIFAQRYMYGLRTIIPLAIGVTRYDAKKFAFINLISAFCWASITIVPAYIFGEEILEVVHWAKKHWYFAAPLGITLAVGVYYYLHNVTDPIKRRERKKLKEKNENQTIK
jgi:membrane protein DedA with SNARE-associated domain